ncbi:hypothetical protein V8E54_009801 [Elaphomyces granulatus]
MTNQKDARKRQVTKTNVSKMSSGVFKTKTDVCVTNYKSTDPYGQQAALPSGLDPIAKRKARGLPGTFNEEQKGSWVQSYRHLAIAIGRKYLDGREMFRAFVERCWEPTTRVEPYLRTSLDFLIGHFYLLRGQLRRTAELAEVQDKDREHLSSWLCSQHLPAGGEDLGPAGMSSARRRREDIRQARWGTTGGSSVASGAGPTV